MGLSGRKDKQRIPHDPRNLTWADDAARFGSSYLSKFGWDSSKGLGAGEEGRTSHIKVSQKLDMMGIGGHRSGPEEIAWKQNKDFENLLKRLNAANGDGEEKEEESGSGSVANGFVKGKIEQGEEKKEKKTKEKRKREEDGEGKRKRPRKNEASAEEKPVRVVPRHRSHRARHIAAKSLACTSKTAMAEILGIAASEPEAAPTIRTSSKSLEEYFRGKLGNR